MPRSARTNQENTIIVAKGGGQFDRIQDAIDEIKDSTASNPYVIDIHPGIYEENIVLKDYITLEGRGSGREVVIKADTGTVITLGSGANFLFSLSVESAPTASGVTLIDMPNGGSHEMFIVFPTITSSTNGITGTTVKASSNSSFFFTESAITYTMLGSAVGVNTHNVIDISGTASASFFRSNVFATIGDVDDNVTIFNDDSTGDAVNVSADWRIFAINGSYTGKACVFKHTKSGVTKLDAYSNVLAVGSGAGTAVGICADSSTDDGVYNTSYNLINIVGFTSNKHVEVGSGDLVIVGYDTIIASDGTTGDGTIDFNGTFAHGELTITAGAEFPITEVNEVQGLSNLSEGSFNNTSIHAGEGGSITAFADAGGGQVTVSATTVDLLGGEIVTITGTTNYDGIYFVTNATATDFEITATFVATETGVFNHASHITVAQRGYYQLSWAFSAETAANNKLFQFQAYNGINAIVGTKAIRKFASASDVGSVSGTAAVFLEKGETLWMGISNLTDGTNITLDEGVLLIHKIS